ncbi:NAD(P)/FAD-dependent oxidoreductase [Sorangium sp. So ce1024]|uniref:NAD(P)/FAD-dependent oxidoreductase n=1 Tax=unclassified Sorangium TaxID=2621164 RepID=UPI003F09CC34
MLNAVGLAARHAVVVGAGIAGLIAARVLADHVERVTVLERDRLPPSPEGDARRGAPQGRHIHLLLAGGSRVVERYFPGMDADLAAAGAPGGDCGLRMITHLPARPVPRVRLGFDVRFASRALRERLIRERLDRDARITFRDGAVVKGLIGERGRVAGVRLRREAGGEEALRAELVVAACGREAPVPDWLEEIGCGAPREEIVDAHLSYASRWYQARSADTRDWDLAIDMPSAPHQRRGGAAMRHEDGRWLVTLQGIAGARAPTGDAEFVAWTRSLRVPEIHALIQDAEPISPIHGFGRTANRRRHFEEMARFPDGLVVLGDAVAAFNPVYGQGMSVAALGAQELDACLRAERARTGAPGLDGLSRRFQRRLAHLTDMPWQFATGEDFRWPETAGRRPAATQRFVRAYSDQVMQLIEGDAEAARTLMRVLHFLDPPTALFRPTLAGRVIEHAAGSTLAGARGLAGGAAARLFTLAERRGGGG